jgi:HEAT repeat protein
MGRRPNIEKLEKKRDLARLVAALESDDDGVAEAATAALGRLGTVEATSALLGASAHGRPEVRVAAVRALATSDGMRIVGRLVGMAQADGDESVQQEAIAALRAIGTWEAIDALAELSTATSNGAQAQEPARRVLLDLGSTAVPHVVARLDEGRDQATTAALLLGRIGDPAGVDGLTRAVSRGPADPDACVAALSTIGSDPAIDALIGLLDRGDEHLSRSAALGLAGHASEPRVIDALVRGVSAPAVATREAAVVGLAGVGDGVVVETLRGALQDPAPDVQQEAADALIGRGYRGSDLVDTLIAQTRVDSSWPGLARAAELLGIIGDVRALDPLSRMLDKFDDIDFLARDAARTAIRRIKETADNGSA